MRLYDFDGIAFGPSSYGVAARENGSRRDSIPAMMARTPTGCQVPAHVLAADVATAQESWDRAIRG